MRHGKKFNHLGRTAAHRKSMLTNMACSLIEHKRINTTLAKARELRKFIEPLITKAKTDETHSRRVVFAALRSKVGNRPGGYTRIIKLGNRLGDAAEMCMIELVDFNEIYTASGKTEAAKKSRTRRGSKKKAEEAVAPEVVAEEKAEEKAE